jgi:hypothetical protein
MREDEMEALLRIDGAGLRVRHEYAGFVAEIRLPHDLEERDDPQQTRHHYLFQERGLTRQEAIANVWQKYQQFMTGEHGQAALKALQDGNGQMMFRI